MKALHSLILLVPATALVLGFGAQGGSLRAQGSEGPGGAPSTPIHVAFAPADAAGSGTAGEGQKKFGRRSLESAIEWDAWWSYNRWTYLFADVRRPRGSASGDDFRAEYIEMDPRAKLIVDRTRRAAMPYLRRALVDTHFEVRAAAALALGESGDATSESALMIALDDESMLVRENVILGLGMLGTPTALDTLRAIVRESDAAPAALRKTHGFTLRLRAFAAIALGLAAESHALGAAEVDALTAAALDAHASSDLNVAAVVALGLSKNDSALVPLVAIVRDTNSDLVRAYAVTALGRLGDRGAVTTLLAASADHSVHVRRAAAIALGGLAAPGDAKVIEILEDAADVAFDSAERRFAISALGQIGGVNQADFLIEIIESEREMDSAFAAVALGTLLRRDPTITGERYGAVLHRHLLAAKNPRSRAAFALASGLALHFRGTLELRRLLTEDGAPEVRAAAAQALGLLKDRAAVALLDRAVNSDDDANVRRAAGDALARIDDPSASAVLRRAFDLSRSNLVLGGAVLRNLGVLDDPAAILPIVETLRAESSAMDQQRVQAVAALGRMIDQNRVPRLAALGESENYVSPTGVLADVLARVP